MRLMVKRLLAACFLLMACAAVAQTPAVISSPANGSTLGGSSQTFIWNATPGAELYQLWVGNSAGAYDIGYYPASGTTATSVTVDGLPTDGRTLHVRLWSAIDGAWYSSDATYTAHTPPVAAAIFAPPSGTTFESTTQTFLWNAAPGATLYQLWIGSAVGSYDLGYFPASGTTGTSTDVSGLPVDGRTLYVRLWTAVDGNWYSRDFVYTATSSAAVLTFPANGSTLSSSEQTFSWRKVPNGTLYQLWIGSAPGGNDVGVYTTDSFGSTAYTGGLPRDSRVLYVRLYTLIDGQEYHYRDYTYTAASPPGVAAISAPAGGSTLAYEPTFTWSSTGADSYEIWVGSTPGTYDLAKVTAYGSGGQVYGLPFDGRTVYVRLVTGGGRFAPFGYNDYVYTLGVPAALVSPLDGASLATSQTFTWTNVGASTYYFQLRTSQGGPAIAYYYGIGTTYTNNALPNGGTVYATLTSYMRDGRSFTREYTFNLPPVQPATVLLPQEGATLTGDSQLFQWDWTSGASYYQLWVGSSPGTYDIGYYPPAGTTQTSVLATGLPTDGRTLYIRLWTVAGDQAISSDSTVIAATSTSDAAAMWFPGIDGVLLGPQTFRWNPAAGADGYQLWVGSSPGAYDLGYFPAGLTSDSFVTVPTLPGDGRRLYVRLWTSKSGGYSYRDYGYRAIKSFDAVLPMPTRGWTLPGPAQAFGGAVGMGNQDNLRMVIGNSVGSAEFGGGSVGGLQTTFSNLPVDGRALYARESWTSSGEPRFRDYEMTAAPAGPAAVMLSPPNDYGLWGIGTSQTFTFSNVGAASYKIWSGTPQPGQYTEFVAAPGATSITVTYPAGTVPTQIRLWSLVGGVWYYRDYSYQHFFG
jgi:hypothetical protein